MLFLTLFCILPSISAYAQKSYVKEVQVEKFEFETDEELNQFLLEELQAKEKVDLEDVIFINKKINNTEYYLDYSYSYYHVEHETWYNELDTKKILIENEADFSEEEKQQYVEEIVLKELEYYTDAVIKEIELEPIRREYLVTYQLYSESEEYKKTVADFFKVSSTKKDSKAVFSKISLYIHGYRVPYLLEDNGEFYIPAFYIDDIDLDERENKKEFYNLNWKSTKKTGEVIGKIKKGKETGEYTINNTSYLKLSEFIPDWRKSLTYDKETKCFIYGSKPIKKDKQLKTDIIYDFAKKTTKGCKTTTEKIKALHDTIVLKCTYDSENMDYYGDWNKYNMTSNQAMALHMLKDKSGICENYARLFRECCVRLFIPCDLVSGDAIDHMWNRVYIGSKEYHIDVTYADYLNNNYKKASDIRRTYYLKSAYDFMGSHTWEDYDYTPYKFSKEWKKIDKNNIKTTEQLRKAAIYASYLYSKGGKDTYKFKITGKNVNTRFTQYVASNGFAFATIKGSYKNGVYTMQFVPQEEWW